MRTWIERQQYLIDYTVLALMRRKGRNLALFVVYAILVFLLASVMLFGHALREEARLLLKDAPEVVVQRLEAGRHALLAATDVAVLARIRGVREGRGRLWGYFHDPVSRANFTLMVPAAEAPGAGRVVLGSGLARARGAAVGDLLSLRGSDGAPRSFQVDGILGHESALVASDLMLVSEGDFRAFMGVPTGWYTDAALVVANPREVRKVAEKVVRELPSARPILREELLRTYQSLFNWREGVLLVLLTGALLAFVIFAWDKASGLSAEERREIGILKAIGWDTGEVLVMKFWEGLIVSLGAFLMGYVLAYGHVFGLAGALFLPVLKGWATLYPEFVLTPRVDGLQVVTLFFLTVFPYTAATLVPVWRVAVSDPDAVMR